jgi:hypothetical protein
MNKPILTVGEFLPFVDEIEIAEVSGPSVDRTCSILATRPFFRDKDEAELLSFEDQMTAFEMAVSSSGLMATAMEVGEAEDSVELVVFSKSGALAVRGTYSGVSIHDSALEAISWFDDGNRITAAHPFPMQVS